MGNLKKSEKKLLIKALSTNSIFIYISFPSNINQ